MGTGTDIDITSSRWPQEKMTKVSQNQGCITFIKIILPWVGVFVSFENFAMYEDLPGRFSNQNFVQLQFCALDMPELVKLQNVCRLGNDSK